MSVDPTTAAVELEWAQCDRCGGPEVLEWLNRRSGRDRVTEWHCQRCRPANPALNTLERYLLQRLFLQRPHLRGLCDEVIEGGPAALTALKTIGVNAGRNLQGLSGRDAMLLARWEAGAGPQRWIPDGPA